MGSISAMFTAIGIWMIVDREPYGWAVTLFFGACLLVAVFDRWLPKPWLRSEFSLVMTADEITCMYRRRARESIRWADVERIWYVTTSDGPHLPDEWIVLEGAGGGCSFPTEVPEISPFWDELGTRFPGFDFGPLIRGGTTEARHLCWPPDRSKAHSA
jgi:hypothetical protein